MCEQIRNSAADHKQTQDIIHFSTSRTGGIFLKQNFWKHHNCRIEIVEKIIICLPSLFLAFSYNYICCIICSSHTGVLNGEQVNIFGWKKAQNGISSPLQLMTVLFATSQGFTISFLHLWVQTENLHFWPSFHLYVLHCLPGERKISHLGALLARVQHVIYFRLPRNDNSYKAYQRALAYLRWQNTSSSLRWGWSAPHWPVTLILSSQ